VHAPVRMDPRAAACRRVVGCARAAGSRCRIRRCWSLAGAVLAFLPIAPEIEIDPDLALALFVAAGPARCGVRHIAARAQAQCAALTSLAIVAVLNNHRRRVALIGWELAGLPLAAAIALGAIVAPPDAAAAAAVLRQFRPPRRLMAVLQGESLLNDATALLAYRMAVVAATGVLVLASAIPILALSDDWQHRGRAMCWRGCSASP